MTPHLATAEGVLRLTAYPAETPTVDFTSAHGGAYVADRPAVVALGRLAHDLLRAAALSLEDSTA